MITEALIIRKSGEYDCEVITKLKIDKMGMVCLALFLLWPYSLSRNDGIRNSKNYLFRELSFLNWSWLVLQWGLHPSISTPPPHVISYLLISLHILSLPLPSPYLLPACLTIAITMHQPHLSLKINQLNGIEHLTLLKRLNLSHNKIRRIGLVACLALISHSTNLFRQCPRPRLLGDAWPESQSHRTDRWRE